MSTHNTRPVKSTLTTAERRKVPRPAKPAKKANRKVMPITPKSLGLKVRVHGVRVHGVRVGDAFSAGSSWRWSEIVVVAVDPKTLKATVRHVGNGHARKIKMARLQSELDFTRLGTIATKAAHRDLCVVLNLKQRSGR